MNDLDIRERKIIVAWTGKLWQAIIDNFAQDFKDILVWNTRGIHQEFPAYEIGELSKNNSIPKNAIWIISCVWDWVLKALEDFSEIWVPTVLLSTAYREKLLDKYISKIPLLKAPNTFIPVIELIKIFEEFDTFLWMDIKMHESHPVWKQDVSGTHRRIIQILKTKNSSFNFEWCNLYNPDEWKSFFWDLISYRWDSSQELDIPEAYMDAHAYHTYEITWSSISSVHDDFFHKISLWVQKYKDNNSTWFDIWIDDKYQKGLDKSYRFWHNVNGRDVYADWLRQILPWFVKQDVWVHEVTNYLAQN